MRRTTSFVFELVKAYKRGKFPRTFTVRMAKEWGLKAGILDGVAGRYRAPVESLLRNADINFPRSSPLSRKVLKSKAGKNGEVVYTIRDAGLMMTPMPAVKVGYSRRRKNRAGSAAHISSGLSTKVLNRKRTTPKQALVNRYPAALLGTATAIATKTGISFKSVTIVIEALAIEALGTGTMAKELLERLGCNEA